MFINELKQLETKKNRRYAKNSDVVNNKQKVDETSKTMILLQWVHC